MTRQLSATTTCGFYSCSFVVYSRRRSMASKIRAGSVSAHTFSSFRNISYLFFLNDTKLPIAFDLTWIQRLFLTLSISSTIYSTWNEIETTLQMPDETSWCLLQVESLMWEGIRLSQTTMHNCNCLWWFIFFFRRIAFYRPIVRGVVV